MNPVHLISVVNELAFSLYWFVKYLFTRN